MVLSSKLTHFTFGVTNLDASLAFYAHWFDLVIVHDKRPMGSRGALGDDSRPVEIDPPDFLFVIQEEEEPAVLDHFGFQVERREELERIAEAAKTAGVWIMGPIDLGGMVGSFVTIRDPDGHRWGIYLWSAHWWSIRRD